MAGKIIRYVCRDCGSSEVHTDAYAEWDSAREEDVLCNTFDDTFCKSCTESCKVDEEEIIDILELAEIFAQRRKNRAYDQGLQTSEFLREILDQLDRETRTKAEELLRYIDHDPLTPEEETDEPPLVGSV